MRIVNFRNSTGLVGSTVEEIMEFEDGTTDEEVGEAFEAWLSNFDCGWEDI